MPTNIYYFNPTVEQEVATKHYTPITAIKEFQNDLSYLMFVFAGVDDFVISKNKVDRGFTDMLESLGFAIPKFATIEEIKNSNISIESILPWGWSFQTHQLFAPIKHLCSSNFISLPNSKWNDSYKIYYERKNTINILETLYSQSNSDIYICKLPKSCVEISGVEQLTKIWKEVLLKEPLSSSGKGVFLFDCTDKIRKRTKNIISKYGYIIAEEKYNKIGEFGIQLRIKNNQNIEFVGTSSFLTSKDFKYEGNLINPFNNKIIKDLNIDTSTFDVVVNDLIRALKSNVLYKNYDGLLGVDIMFCNQYGKVLINPCSEVNVRYNMGLVSLALEKHIDSNSTGFLRMKYFKNANDIRDFIEFNNKKTPLIIENQKIKKGFVQLTPVFNETRFLAFIIISYEL